MGINIGREEKERESEAQIWRGEREIDMERECVCFGGEIERGNKEETHIYKYRYYIVLYNQPRSILTWIYHAPKKRFSHREIGSLSALDRSGLKWV